MKREQTIVRYDINIKKLREIIIVSQEELAKVLRVSIGTVNRWENGKFVPNIKAKKSCKNFLKSTALNECNYQF